MSKISLVLLMTLSSCSVMMAETNTTEELKDMSDPLAVYTRGGMGITNRGINIKVGIQYDSGVENENVMNVLEVKGIAGDAIGWDGPYVRSDSVDSIRYRNFKLNKTNARARQIDVTYDLHKESGDISYSLLQGLPKWGQFMLYPLGGLGLSVVKDAPEDDGSIKSGYSVPGVFAAVGFYGKYTVSENIWINYNPFWYVSLVGTDWYTDEYFEGGSSVLTHEVTLSYKLSPRSNVRYYGNWSENVDISDGAHRIEYNYQF